MWSIEGVETRRESEGGVREGEKRERTWAIDDEVLVLVRAKLLLQPVEVVQKVPKKQSRRSKRSVAISKSSVGLRAERGRVELSLSSLPPFSPLPQPVTTLEI